MIHTGGDFFVQLLDYIFPRRCVNCGRIGSYFCDRCAPLIRIIRANEAICPVCEKPAVGGVTHPRCRSRYSPDGLTSFFHYDGPVRKAVKAIKYRYISDLTREFMRFVPAASFTSIRLLRFQPDILLPVPLHPARQRFRGFNQAEILGTFVAGALHIPMRTDILRRTRETTAQVEMKSRKERLKNMEGVFQVNAGAVTRRRPSSVLLFDDVFTTGATMRSAAGVLKRAGVKSVWALTMAR